MKLPHLSPPVRAALLYALFGGVWILGSDWLVSALARDAAAAARLQTCKGWFFVAASAVLIFGLLRHELTARQGAEEERLESEQRYRLLFETSLDAILLTAPDGSIYAANPAAGRLFDRTEAEICRLGRSGVADSADPRLQAALEERARTGKFSGELTFLRRDGSRFPGEISTALFKDKQGRDRTSMIIRDVSERKRAEEMLRESEERYRLLVDRSPYAIGVHQDGELVFANPAAVRLFGAQSVSDLIGKPIMELVSPETREAARDRIGRMLKGETGLYPAEDRYVQLDGSVVPVEVTAAPFTLGGHPAIQVIALDIARRKQAEQALEKRYKELSAIYDASQRLQKLLSPDLLAQEIIQVLEDTLEYSYGAVLLVDATTGMLEPFALSNQKRDAEFLAADKDYVRSKGVRLGIGVTGWVAEHGRSLRFEDVRKEPRYLALREGILSELCVPLRIQDRVIGVVNVESTKASAYTEDDQRLLETIAAQITVAIHNSNLLESVATQANQLRALTVRLAEVEEIERRSLARELHDRVGQTLTALNINLNILQAQLPAEALQQVGARIEDSTRLVDETVACVRDVMANLHPPVLADYGLGAALRWYAEQFTQRTEIPVRVEAAEQAAPGLPSHLEAVLFRVAQEALTNVARHAAARRIQVTLETVAGTTRLVIADDGRGFDPLAVAPDEQRGWGLRTMRERLEAVGGSFRLISALGEGTKIIAEITPPPAESE
ncbi:MAG: PAS domain S-box protein [Chloroflexota bacterium]